MGIAVYGARAVRAAPGSYRLADHFVSRTNCLDRVIHLPEAVRVVLRGDIRLVSTVRRPLDGKIRLVANKPYFAARRVLHEVRASLGEVGVILGQRDRAFRAVAVVDAADDSVPLR